VGALPSGRGAGEPLTLGISPSLAGTRTGPTAFLRSVAAIDFTEAANGSNLTMGLDPLVFAPGNNGSLFVSLLRSYFKLGGMQVQFNVLDEAVLRQAQQDPDKFRWLTVRVAGYCAYFTDLTREAQDEIVQRVANLGKGSGH
jgi:formate C-acetyltransferase